MPERSGSTTPWEFRARGLLITAAYGVGFGLGYPLQSALLRGTDPTFVVVGARFGHAGVVAAVWTAAGLTIAAWLVRLWGSSFHAPGVVMGADVVADTFTAAGPYRFVRNPLYLGNVLLAAGIGSLGPPAATVLVVALNLVIVLRLIAIEESFLRRTNGAAYERYCAAVPRLLPRLAPAPLPPDPRNPNVGYGFITELLVLGFAAATTYVAIVAPAGGGGNAGIVFWSIAAAGLVLHAALGRAARRAGGHGS